MITIQAMNADQYRTLTYNIISNVEAVHTTAYLDSVGIPTIGIGFNLRVASVRNEILKQFELDPNRQSLTVIEQQTEREYVLEIANIVNQNFTDAAQLRTALNDVLVRRSNDPRLANLNRINGFAFRTTFEFANDTEIRSVFNVVIGDYENYVDNWLSGIPESRERAALVSMAYNSPTLLGPGLRAAVDNDDRAEAWFQIRYSSNGGASRSAGIAKRRYYESAVFGLYDETTTAANIGDEESRKVFLMFQRHKATILAYEQQFSHMINQGNIDYNLAGGNTIQTIDASLSLAGDYLIEHYANPYHQHLNGQTFSYRDIIVFGSDEISTSRTGDQAANLMVGNTWDNWMYGGDGDDLLFGESGSDYLFGDDGRDVLVGGDFHDYLYGGDGDDVLLGGHGDDKLFGGAGADLLLGGEYDDNLYGGSDTEADILRGC